MDSMSSFHQSNGVSTDGRLHKETPVNRNQHVNSLNKLHKLKHFLTQDQISPTNNSSNNNTSITTPTTLTPSPQSSTTINYQQSQGERTTGSNYSSTSSSAGSDSSKSTSSNEYTLINDNQDFPSTSTLNDEAGLNLSDVSSNSSSFSNNNNHNNNNLNNETDNKLSNLGKATTDTPNSGNQIPPTKPESVTHHPTQPNIRPEPLFICNPMAYLADDSSRQPHHHHDGGNDENNNYEDNTRGEGEIDTELFIKNNGDDDINYNNDNIIKVAQRQSSISNPHSTKPYTSSVRQQPTIRDSPGVKRLLSRLPLRISADDKKFGSLRRPLLNFDPSASMSKQSTLSLPIAITVNHTTDNQEGDTLRGLPSPGTNSCRTYIPWPNQPLSTRKTDSNISGAGTISPLGRNSGILRKDLNSSPSLSEDSFNPRGSPRGRKDLNLEPDAGSLTSVRHGKLPAGATNQRQESVPGTSVVFYCGPDDEVDDLDPIDGVSLLGFAKTNDDDERNVDEVQKQEANRVLRESLFLILSSLYGILVVLIGAVIPITDVFISDGVDRTFEAFYVYLYGVSLLFLVYVYAYLLRRNRFHNDLINISATWVRQLSRVWSRTATDTLENKQGPKRKMTTKRTISLDLSNHHTGTFYLRLGVLGFGMGSMIHCGLQFGSYFSLSPECSQTIQMIKPLLHMMFAFFQLYFIFMNSKMCIHRYKKLARFGLMHMCATNICVWFRSIVVETVHVISSHKHRGPAHNQDGGNQHGEGQGDSAHIDNKSENTMKAGVHLYSSNLLKYVVTTTTDPHGANLSYGNDNTNDCYWSKVMKKAASSAAPYLYPCTIEYSLMCACILYIMWKNVGQRPLRRRTLLDQDTADDDDKKRMHTMSVDCTSSSRGLFLGILTIVGSIISIIAFYMLVREPGLKHTAYVLTHLSETAVYFLTLIALIMACFKMKTFTFKVQQEAELEDILIVISYTGLVAFIVFSLMASIIHEASISCILNIVSNVTMLIQATLQTIFMLAGDRMSAANHEQVKKKPGREYVTFMLISNFAMWAINTFETQTPEHNPIQVDVYGIEAWAIFTHISVPLGIYYRFHSTVCMSNIWKNAWKLKKLEEAIVSNMTERTRQHLDGQI